MDTSSGRAASALLASLPPTARAGDTSHSPGIGVLSNRVLWDLITGFMSGYPLAVSKFYNENQKFRRLMHLQRRPKDGVLSHLAIAMNDPEMIQLLHSLSKRPEHRGDPKLSFANVMCRAIEYGQVDTLACISGLKARDPECRCEPSLTSIVLRQPNPDIKVLDWLLHHLPPDTDALQLTKCLTLRQRMLLPAIAGVRAGRRILYQLNSAKPLSEENSSCHDMSTSTAGSMVDERAPVLVLPITATWTSGSSA